MELYFSTRTVPIYLHGIHRDFIRLDNVHCHRKFYVDKASDNRHSEEEHFLIMETDPLFPKQCVKRAGRYATPKTISFITL